VKSKIKNGEVTDSGSYYDLTGSTPVRPKGLTDEQWNNQKGETTHFKAIP
jgi:hypothetical protein